jgi:hypothetical protein
METLYEKTGKSNVIYCINIILYNKYVHNCTINTFITFFRTMT